MKGCGQVPGIVLFCRPTIHHEESDPILKGKSIILLRPVCVAVKLTGDEYLVINDLLVGLKNLRDRHRHTQGLTQVSVLLFQSHQAASKEILVHLAPTHQRHERQLICCCCFC